MKIDHLVLGDYETNCYCLRADEAAESCLIIDTGLQAEPLIDFLKENHLTPEAVIFTHGHADHISGAGLLRKNYPDVKIAISKLDAPMLASSIANGSVLTGTPFTTGPADILIEDEGPIALAGIEFEVLHVPGHTPGGISLYSRSEGLVFVGDSLFAGSIGRTDLPGGDYNQLIASLKSRLLSLDDETRVLPGHGLMTTIGIERASNPYLK